MPYLIFAEYLQAWRTTVLVRHTLSLAGIVIIVSVATVHAQPVTQEMMCAEAVQTVNPQFLTNIMSQVIRAGMEGSGGVSVWDKASWLDRFINLPGGRTGDAGASAGEALDRGAMSVGGGGPSEAQQLAAGSRARAAAEILLPALVHTCDQSPSRHVIDAIQDVLFKAGYMNEPAHSGDTLVASQPNTAPGTVQGASSSVSSGAFKAGSDARATWEGWFAAQSGAYKAGAEFWASQRSLPKPGSCRNSVASDEFVLGCEAASRMLSSFDSRRRVELDFRRGWNSLPVQQATEAPSSPAGSSSDVAATTKVQGLPTKEASCVTTTITALVHRLQDGLDGPYVPDSGSAVRFADGGYQVSYDEVPQVRRSRAGDPVTLCLIHIPQNCPAGDARGRIYTTTDMRTMESWTMADSEHVCGGA